MRRTKINFAQWAEVIFNTGYLLTVFVIGLYYLTFSAVTVVKLWGVMALILAGGDSFHLVPRIRTVFCAEPQRFQTALGRGKQLTSITMTFFYFLLWHLGLAIFSLKLPVLTGAISMLTSLRILLCIFPQNRWTSCNPPVSWGVYRNLPFFVMGAVVAVLYSRYAYVIPQLRWMWLAILLSFLFYLPVVLWVHRYPKLGMLMIPKSCAYIWIVCMGAGLQ